MRLLSCFSIVALLALGGCATYGRDFSRPVASELTLGQTTKKEIVAKFGPPREDDTRTMKLKKPDEKEGSPAPNAESGLYTTLFYSFVDPMGEAAEGVSPQRGAYFWLWNDKLVGYEYISSFRADSTNFNEERIPKIERMKSSEKDIVALFGQPVGSSIYPRTRYPGDRSLAYAYFEWNKARRESVLKRLIVDVTPEGMVRDFRYENRAKPLPMPPAGPAVVPIIIPTRR